MTTRQPLSEDQFRHVVRCAPLVSIDLLIFDPAEHVLVGLRNNEPAKGVYFVPGGIIRKGELLKDAFGRILLAETGQEALIGAARFLGPFEHFYATNRFGDAEFGTHYVVLAYRLQLDRRPEIKLNDQHSKLRWMSVAGILAAPDVHENTKAYFRYPG
jgi:colanic acid biosynthesis protein WcaH